VPTTRSWASTPRRASSRPRSRRRSTEQRAVCCAGPRRRQRRCTVPFSHLESAARRTPMLALAAAGWLLACCPLRCQLHSYPMRASDL
jgi:hypothetical protein